MYAPIIRREITKSKYLEILTFRSKSQHNEAITKSKYLEIVEVARNNIQETYAQIICREINRR